jgi:hypothetical protein
MKGCLRLEDWELYFPDRRSLTNMNFEYLNSLQKSFDALCFGTQSSGLEDSVLVYTLPMCSNNMSFTL